MPELCPRAVRHALERDYVQAGRVTDISQWRTGHCSNLVRLTKDRQRLFCSALNRFNELGVPGSTCLWTCCERDRGPVRRMPAYLRASAWTTFRISARGSPGCTNTGRRIVYVAM